MRMEICALAAPALCGARDMYNRTDETDKTDVEMKWKMFDREKPWDVPDHNDACLIVEKSGSVRVATWDSSKSRFVGLPAVYNIEDPVLWKRFDWPDKKGGEVDDTDETDGTKRVMIFNILSPCWGRCCHTTNKKNKKKAKSE